MHLAIEGTLCGTLQRASRYSTLFIGLMPIRLLQLACSQAFLAIADVLTACMMQTMMNNASAWK